MDKPHNQSKHQFWFVKAIISVLTIEPFSPGGPKGPAGPRSPCGKKKQNYEPICTFNSL